MTVYVDDHYKHATSHYGRMKMSHMIADTDEELEAMARKLGLKKKWKHNDHYDVSISLRKLAIAYGARTITLRQCAILSYKWRRARAAAMEFI